MRILFCGILLILAILLLSVCNSHSESLLLLREAERIIEINPDSALLLLESIADSEGLSETDHMKYQLRIVQARYKNFIPISNDTTIFQVRDYFAKKTGSNWDLSFLSYFYSGCVYRENQQYDIALKEYKQALAVAQQHNDEVKQALVLYNIGDLYFGKRSYEQALTYYRQAVDKYENNSDRKLVSLRAAAQTSLLSGQPDSAFVYFNAALSLAKLQGDKSQEAHILQNMAIAFFEQGDSDEALSLLYTAKETNPDTTQIARYHLNLAEIYRASGAKDSSTYYTRKLQESIKKSSDIYFLAAVNDFLAQVFEAEGNYRTANFYLQAKDSCLLHIMEESNVNALVEAERKYNIATKETLLAKEKTRNYQLSFIVSVTGLALVLISVAGFYFYDKHRRQKAEFYWLKQETERNAYLNQVYRSCLGNVTIFKNYVKDLAVGYSQKDKKEAQAGYAKIERALADLEASINAGYAPIVSDFIRSLRLMNNEQIKLLNPEEQLLITLLYARHEHAQIASLLRINNHALSARKSRLRNKLLKVGLSKYQVSEIFISK